VAISTSESSSEIWSPLLFSHFVMVASIILSPILGINISNLAMKINFGLKALFAWLVSRCKSNQLINKESP
jgi:ABC-type Fe3+ transport system permease subunit